MCDKAVDNFAHGLKPAPDCYTTEKMCNKSITTYPSTIELVPEFYKTQEMYDKVVNGYFLYFILFLIDIKVKKCVTELFTKILL